MGGLTAGPHVAVFAPAGALLPSLDCLRLTQAGAHVTARAVVLGGR